MTDSEINRVKALVIGISGCSSSGKTTLSRILRDRILPNAFILHEDDFYKEEDKIPIINNFQDWDCAEALDVPSLISTLDHVRSHGSVAPTFESKENTNTMKGHNVSESAISRIRERVTSHGLSPVPMALLDGFLLYPIEAVRPYLDVKLLLRATSAHGKARREERGGYATIEGWWSDPPGYWDLCVWPNYVKEHGFLFEGGNVEGRVDEERARAIGVHVQPRLDMSLEDILGVDRRCDPARGGTRWSDSS